MELNVFENIALPFVLAHEGGFVDNPHDSGGATNKGVTQATYDVWRLKNGEYKRPVQQIEDNEVHDIYKAFYWGACKCDEIPYPLNFAIFDFNVNAGANAIKVLQKILHVTEDGILGSATLGVIQTNTRVYEDTAALTGKYLDARAEYYRAIGVGKNAEFLGGWIARVEDLKRKFLMA
ncbi:MAG: N-acetylmuramidase [Patescibacteria group bacterium]|nr:N-acetylmuramidase [Patescibacteria group bacterium]